MARAINPVIELNRKQTAEFLASLFDGKNEANRRKAIDLAKSMNVEVKR